MLNENDLEKYIFENIPICMAMGINIEKLSLKEIIISAPLSKNINHKKTVFGGSLQAIATLACWSLLHVNLNEFNNAYEIVISESSIKFLVPIINDFKVQCSIPLKNDWEIFMKTLHKHKKSRIKVEAHIIQENKLSVFFQGMFVAIKRK